MPATYHLTAPHGRCRNLACRSIAAAAAQILLLLAGCARQPVLEPLYTPARAPTQTYAWECERNFAFVARREGDAMWLFLPGRAVKLPRVEASSGAVDTREVTVNISIDNRRLHGCGGTLH